MTFSIRSMTASDAAAWAMMRQSLWPFTTPGENQREVAGMLAASDMWGFIATDEAGIAVGFAEVTLRRYANGCEQSPVPFLEGIWIAPAARRHGLGRDVMAHIADFFRAKSFTEICSDALLDNTVSHKAHREWGFEETERVVYFRKALS